LVGKTGETVQTIRDLILIDQRLEKILQTFVKSSPYETMWVLRAIQFRRLVLEEFNRLAKKKEHGERIAAAEAQAARRAAAEIPAPPLLHELVVTA
jgi:hypothetical protein